ncbi:hypothetical protein Lqui_2665 [Legionella quinlivanii]|uniref:DUF6671 domain-containing protein n=1 Tax=Legionella quinlivanii TaxID=45073 RepID=A0A0W0XKS5_9GAMM|nr:DUF6671 family protein [Legionella quinlivanii]KTD45194.1 hypothetical protein Lqui_2665 [Legionella quinlivanii]SEG05513.1 hypothetical protein SAMN02746093_01761 [Legionella quinlivanii DSM 21216]STY11507.1 Uncharacterised protein [Legionella quinlivanii]
MHYRNQSVLLASKHEKEKAIAKVFFDTLSCTLDVHEFDTDQFGSFTGEIPRTLSPYDTCVLKAKRAAEDYGYDLVIASEGSFGPHPAFPFTPVDHEIMVFLDRKHNWVIAEQYTTPKTNYRMMTITTQTELSDFLDKAGFPEHGLTLQTNRDKKVLAKGIRDITALKNALSLGFQNEKELFLATDMRAMMNPTRMNAISILAEKLAHRIQCCCPECLAPGFGFNQVSGYLPCGECSAPTSLCQYEIWGCIQCDYQEKRPRRDGVKVAEPQYCDYCNP